MGSGKGLRVCEACGRNCDEKNTSCPYCGASFENLPPEPFAPIPISLEQLGPSSDVPLDDSFTELDPGFWKEALRDIPMPEPASQPTQRKGPKESKKQDKERDPIDDFEELYFDEKTASEKAPCKTEKSKASSSPRSEQEKKEKEFAATSEDASTVDVHDADVPPALPDFSKEVDPAIELPDLEVRANLLDDPGVVKIPKWSEYDDRPKKIKLTLRRLRRIFHSPLTNLVFVKGSKRYFFTVLFLELILCFPCGYLAWRYTRQTLVNILVQDVLGASEELKRAKFCLMIGGGIVAAVVLGVLGYIAAYQTDWAAIEWVER